MVNTLDLDPEWGAIDLIEEVEATFEIKIADEEAERCATVGDLYDVVSTHSPNWGSESGSCGSSMVFYCFRRSLSPDNRRGVTGDSVLAEIELQPARLFKKLANDTGLRLPEYELTWLGMTGGFVLVGGVLAAIVALFTGHWAIAGTSALIAVLGLPLIRLDAGRLPAGIITVADLVRRTVPLNAKRLKEAGGRPADRWEVLVALAAEHGMLAPDEIGPETVFHRTQLRSVRR